MITEKITFPGSAGTLAARLDRPDGPALAYALFAHCFTCSKDIFAASRIARELADLGIAVLRFDFTGLGASEGEFANTNFSSNVTDLVRAADWMRQSLHAPSILIGHSLGGAAVLAAAGEIEEARAVVTIGAPFQPDHVTHHFDDAIPVIEKEGEAEVRIGGRPFRVQKQFLEDIKGHDQAKRIHDLRKALLVMHAPLDKTVGVENAARIFDAALHPKSFISLDDADHLLSRQSDAAYVAGVVAAWVRPYVEDLAPAASDENTPEEGLVVVAETGHGRYLNAVDFGGQRLLADEPVSVGGSGKGPNPYDLLLASLGACTSMTMRMYAEHKDIPLKGVKVSLRHRKVHAEDCEDCDSTSGQIDEIDRIIAIEGDLSAEQRDGLMRIADKCPVHRTLHGEVKVRTRSD